MKHKIYILCAVILTFAFILEGCSYKDIDKKLQGVVYGNDEYATIEISTVALENMFFKGVGDTLSNYIYIENAQLAEYAGGVTETIECGVKGLEFTLNSVRVYKTFYDTGIDMSEISLFDEDNEEHIKILQSNAFIMLDMTAKYTAPENGDNEVFASADFVAGYAPGRGNDNFADIHSDFEKEPPPQMMYFSNHPTDEDERLDSKHNYCHFYIKDGEPIDFQVGFIAAMDFVETKNILLQVVELDYNVFVDLKCEYFDLLNDFDGVILTAEESTI